MTRERYHFIPVWIRHSPLKITNGSKVHKSEHTFCRACARLAASPFGAWVSYESNSTSTLSSQVHSSSCAQCSRLASCRACSRVLATSALNLVMSLYLALMASNLSWIIKTSSPKISKACYSSWKEKEGGRRNGFFRYYYILMRFSRLGGGVGGGGGEL